jgi:hypothetical protein
MRDMPLSLAWFLGSIFMLAGAVAAWVMRKANRDNTASLRGRTEVVGTIVRYRSESDRGDDWGFRGGTIEYSFNGQRYEITSELDPDRHPVGERIAVMVLASQPSDAVARLDLAPVSMRWPVAIVLFGLVLIAWGYAEEYGWLGGR